MTDVVKRCIEIFLRTRYPVLRCADRYFL